MTQNKSGLIPFPVLSCTVISCLSIQRVAAQGPSEITVCDSAAEQDASRRQETQSSCDST